MGYYVVMSTFRHKTHWFPEASYLIVLHTSSTKLILEAGDSSGSSSVQHWINNNPCFFVEKFNSFTLDSTLMKSFLYTLFFWWMSEDKFATNFSKSSSDVTEVFVLTFFKGPEDTCNSLAVWLTCANLEVAKNLQNNKEVSWKCIYTKEKY